MRRPTLNAALTATLWVCITLASSVPTGAWRAVDNGLIGPTNECFIDELAIAAGQNPYEFRRNNLKETFNEDGTVERTQNQASKLAVSLTRNIIGTRICDEVAACHQKK